MTSIVIKNGVIATLGTGNQVLHNHDLLIENGVISKIGQKLKGDKVIDAKGRLVLPGFINAHMHYYSSLVKGLGKADPSANFGEVLENLWWRLDKKLSLEDCYYSALVANIEAIKKGTTTLIDHHASPGAIKGSLDECARAVLDSGLRACLCYELSDRDGAQTISDGIDENIDFIKKCKTDSSDQLRALFGLHASFTICDETLEKAVVAAKKYNAGFHVHTAEAQSDQDKTIEMAGKRVVERFHEHGILGEKTICAHCVHIDDHERELLAKTNTMVVHNPQSNMNNAVGVADIFKMKQAGILVGLGTDAMTTNMLEELRSAHWIHKLTQDNPSVGFMECIEMLVHNNPKICERYWPNMGLGELKVGGAADVIIMDYYSPTELSSDTIYGHMIFGFSQATVDTTIASGKVLMENKKLISIDEVEVAAKARECAKALWERF